MGTVGGAGFEHLQQGQVAFQQGLEVPVLLQGAGLTGAHVGEMGVEDQGQIACGHGHPLQGLHFKGARTGAGFGAPTGP